MDRKAKILCVDDRIENLRIRALMLEQFGCETLLAEDHASALRLLTENEVDLLLIDYHLANGRTGEEVAVDARVIRPGIPIIMLTGDSKIPESAQRCVNKVLVKGQSHPRMLLDSIQELLPEAMIGHKPKAS